MLNLGDRTDKLGGEIQPKEMPFTWSKPEFRSAVHNISAAVI